MVGSLTDSNDVSVKSNTVKFLCSYGGMILPRHTDGKLRYVGGNTRVLAVDRTVTFSELLVKLGEVCGSSVMTLRCQLPKEDLDALVSVTSDEDLANLIEEYDLAASLKIRAFLSYPKSPKIVSPSTTSSSSSSSSIVSVAPSSVHQSVRRVKKHDNNGAKLCYYPHYPQRNNPSRQMYLVYNGQ
ncbi:hypothetical protein GIB67_006933 [Kingdonia uniflora]|uniref:PB1 domain-containing protein n=1 Tax=Kingdonia uniflora TaxID=39325 RepID=A0A7J7NH29_9MAGN|nr:hypothetical protein GIB67_004410 [Kingdonia uniflora]KAF6166300.1 hypothetical protein GIB67_006933 [Kingdonia uniflora]